MTQHIVHIDEGAAQRWLNGGGMTRELLAWPQSADWQLRISLAEITADGPFSAYPGIGRYFAVVAGAGVFLQWRNYDSAEIARPADLAMTTASEPLHFDGALAPACRLLDGPTLDLNLMWRGGIAHMRAARTALPWQPEGRVCGFFSRVAGVWQDGTNSRQLAAHSLVWQETIDHPGAAFVTAPWVFRADEVDLQEADGTQAPVGWWLGWRKEAA